MKNEKKDLIDVRGDENQGMHFVWPKRFHIKKLVRPPPRGAAALGRPWPSSANHKPSLSQHWPTLADIY